MDTNCPEDVYYALETTTGCILGEEEGDIEQWIGIPYAIPPIDDLRFGRTEPIAPWSEPFEADAFGEVCLQWETTDIGTTLIGDEDCLTLNIFRPEDGEEDPLPILFFTHGGAFTAGAGSLESYALEPQLAQKAIVITHNYRLGPFGFMAHEDITEEDGAIYGDGGSSGNQGFFDSLTALKWVVDNAEVLGGDPNQILVFGESAGASTTCAFLASPLAEGLFQTALIQSVGCGFLEWPLRELDGTGFTYSAEDYGAYIASELGCYGTDTLECLRDLDAENIMDTLASYEFSPNVDHVFLPGPARELFQGGDFNRVPIIAGFNENEGVMFSYTFGINTEEDLLDSLTEAATYYGFPEVSLLSDTYSSAVFGSPQQAYDAFYGDLSFSCPTRSFLDAVSAHVETRGYFFTEAPDWLQYYEGLEEWGAFHGAELPFVFGTNLQYYSTAEQTLSERMQTTWVRSLNAPTIEGIGDWPLFGEGGGISGDGGTLVEFNAQSTETVSGIFQDRCDVLDGLGWHNY